MEVTVGEERDETDGWAPLVSHWRERRGKGLAGWADWAESERGGGRRVLFFVFFQLIFKSIFNLNFEQIFLLQNSHITK